MNFSEWQYEVIDRLLDIYPLDFRWSRFENADSEGFYMSGALTLTGSHYTVSVKRERDAVAVSVRDARDDVIALASWSAAPSYYSGLQEFTCDVLTVACQRLYRDIIIVNIVPPRSRETHTPPLF